MPKGPNGSTEIPIGAYDAYARAVGIALTVLAVLILIGWNTNVLLLKQLSAGFPPVAPLSAICLLLLGLALLLAASPLEIFSSLPAIGLTVLGVIHTGHHLAGYTFTLDQLLNIQPLMPLPFAVASVCGGLAILAIRFAAQNRGAYQLTTLLAFISLNIGVFGTAWYVLDQPNPTAARMGLSACLSWTVASLAIGAMAWGRFVHINAINQKLKTYPLLIMLPALVAVFLAFRDVQPAPPIATAHSSQAQDQQRLLAAAADVRELTQRVRSQARSIAGSSISRKLLDDLQQGATTPAQYADSVARHMHSELQAMFPQLRGLTRMNPEGETLSNTGNPPLAGLPQRLQTASAEQIMSDPIPAAEDLDLYLSTPILDAGGNLRGREISRWNIPELYTFLNSGPRGHALIRADGAGRTISAFAPMMGPNDMVLLRENLDAWSIPEKGLDDLEGILTQPLAEQVLEIANAAPWYLARIDPPAPTGPASNGWTLPKFSTYLVAALLLSIGFFFIAHPRIRLVLPDTQGIAASKFESSRRLKTADDSDITALNTKLITTESEFRSAIMEAPFPIMIYSREGTVLLLNKMWTKLSGYNRKDIPTLDDWIDKAYDFPDQKNDDPMASGVHVLERASDQGDHHILTKNGDTRVWFFNSRMLSGEDASDGKVISMAVDVTETKQAQQELDQFFNLSIEMLCILNFDGQFKRMNPSIMEILGYAEWELKDHNLEEFIHPDDRPGTRQLLKRMTEGEPTLYFENRFRTRDGQYRVLVWSAYPDMKEHLIYAAARDVTEEKIAHNRLRKTTEALQQSNKELETFAYVASHDLREPLRTIGSFTELLAENYHGQLDDEADQYIKFIVEGASRAQALIRALLDYSSAGTKGDPFVLCDTNQIMNEIESSLALIIEETGATLSVEDLPRVYADRIQLSQVLQNLVNNAIKFRQEGVTPQITVQSEETDDAFLFKVRDNGIGIEEKFFDRIFTLFQRLHGAQFDGTGLGLSICKRMIDRHRGRMWVESTVGEGSTFFFTLPKESPTLSDGMNLEV